VTLRKALVLALARRDLLGLLRSPRLYVLASLYLLAQGTLFGVAYLADPGTAARSLARTLSYVWLVFAPALAANSFAAEKDSGELSSLLGDPVSEEELVAAKFLALTGVVLPLAGSFLLPALASTWLIQTPPTVLTSTLLGLELVALTATSIGIFASSVAGQVGSALLLGLALEVLFAGVGMQVQGWITGESQDPLWLLDLLLRGILDSRSLILLPATGLLALTGATAFLRSTRFPPHIDSETGFRTGAFQEVGYLIGGLLRSAGPPLLGFVLLLGVVLKLPVSVDVSGYLGLTPGFQAQLHDLPAPVEIYRPVPLGGLHQDALADLLDEVVRKATGKILFRPLTPESFRSRLHPLGLASPPREGLVLASKVSLRVLPGDQLDVPSGEAEATLARGLADLLAPKLRGRLMLADGHGEKSRLPQFPGDPAALSVLARSLSVIGIQTSGIWLQGEAEHLGKQDILAVIGPQKPLPLTDMEAVWAHHKRGGAVLVAADPEFPEATQELLLGLGFSSLEGTVVDSHGTLAGAGPSTLLLSVSPKHPLGRVLGGIRLVIPSTLAWKPDPGSKILVSSGAGARLAKKAVDLRDRFGWTDPGAKGLIQTRDGVGGRVVVLGDSELLTDALLRAHPGNDALLTALAAWLVHMPPPASVSLRALKLRKVLNEEELATLTQLVGVFPTLLVLGAGLLAWLRWRQRLATRVEKAP
jgi:ABC-type transport system involved in multi-copper enzyme maturation permease subunit